MLCLLIPWISPQNETFKEHLQSDIIPSLLKDGVITPNKQRLVEGHSLLERVQKSIDLLRRRDPSGEKLVFKVFDDSQ
jgi:hypothetical protein